MYSVKGSWSGQTFALAATNDSGAKKSRIRRSKEERKTMVQSFIRRYQSSNNGNFPSLNLTHKEVGGSFYTVREIVREIIQENRVLGPGFYSSEEQKDDTIAVNYPVGTVSSEPQGLWFQTDSELIAFSNQDGNETMVLNFDNNGEYTKNFESSIQYSTEQITDGIGKDADNELISSSTSEALVTFDHQEQASTWASLDSNRECFNVIETDNSRFVNHVQTNVISEESHRQLAEGSAGSETFEIDKESEMDVSQYELTVPTEEVEVETFPLRPAITKTDDLGSRSNDPKSFDGRFDDLEAKKDKLSNSTLVFDTVGSLETSSEVVTTKVADDAEVSVSGSPHMMTPHADVNHMVEVNLQNDSVDVPYSQSTNDNDTTLHDRMNQISQLGDSASKAAEENNRESKDASKGMMSLENNNGTSGKTAKEPRVLSAKEFQRDEKAMVGSSPPLDRIDLESWTASKQETNPLLAFFKAFVHAFVSFWSE